MKPFGSSMRPPGSSSPKILPIPYSVSSITPDFLLFKLFRTFVEKREEKRKLKSDKLRLKEEWDKLADAESKQKFIEECQTQVETLKEVRYIPPDVV